MNKWSVVYPYGSIGVYSALVQEWLGADQATSHYINQRWPIFMPRICVTQASSWTNEGLIFSRTLVPLSFNELQGYSTWKLAVLVCQHVHKSASQGKNKVANKVNYQLDSFTVPLHSPLGRQYACQEGCARGLSVAYEKMRNFYQSHTFGSLLA